MSNKFSKLFKRFSILFYCISFIKSIYILCFIIHTLFYTLLHVQTLTHFLLFPTRKLYKIPNTYYILTNVILIYINFHLSKSYLKIAFNFMEFI